MALTIVFAHNPSGWRGGRIVPGGMSDRHIGPVREHLPEGSYKEGPLPKRGADKLNVYYAHRKTYRVTREPGRRSVFAGHGIADKAWRNAERMVRQYDWAITSGPAWTERLVAGGYGQVWEVGYPKLDPIFQGKVGSPWPERDGRVRVLWAPTHGGGGEQYRMADKAPPLAAARRTSHWHRETIYRLLPSSEFLVMEALHPRHRPDWTATLAEFVGADVVVADGGSTIYEAWALGLPVVFPSWLTAAANSQGRRQATFEADIYNQRIGWHADEPDSLARLAAAAADEGITAAEVDFIERVFPAEYRGRSGERFAERLLEAAREG